MASIKTAVKKQIAWGLNAKDRASVRRSRGPRGPGWKGGLSWTVPAAVPGTTGMTAHKQQEFIVADSGGWKPEARVPARERSATSRRHLTRRSGPEALWGLCRRARIPFRRAPPSGPSHLRKAPPPVLSPRASAVPHMHLGGTNIQIPTGGPGRLSVGSSPAAAAPTPTPLSKSRVSWGQRH